MTVIDGVDYGPLAWLVGQWRGEQGMDISPEPEDTEHNPYFETMLFEASGDVTNGEEQKLAVVRYHQLVSRKSTGKVFHNESGYVTWHEQTGLVTTSFCIPRGVSIVAGGKAETTATNVTLTQTASLDSDDYPIAQAPFMRDKASTQSFTRMIEVSATRLHYKQTTVLDIYGKVFDHTDQNTLVKVQGA